ncbi:MAG: tRNA (guanosine(37)-N1)-methyltransferase TrmD [Planctomycetes bacterium]|jgi:tRNA (guanine37-N1)-methyltransferase|nr:tRNA (guanosine(37)-N1)-methyltransferase TrmD [Planctomycetota bacterium]
MTFHIITIFPDIFNSYFKESIIKRAQEKKQISIKIYDLRNWASDRHRSVDDTPYGGGAGMVMKIEPLYKALKEIKGRKKNIKVILFSAKGKVWNQQLAQIYSNNKKAQDYILICGRYEGVDERLLNFIDEEISIGNYVLTGGEIPAMIFVDSLTRLLPGVLGNEESAIEESHSQPGILEYPHYTKPHCFSVGRKKYFVPEILLSGDHQKIKAWREKMSRRITNS